ncbi:3-hydroxybutyryl-CoA dehydratase [Pseudohalocynthiibacter aestuariivivens]|uniref:Enoyl-CoA hydratase-related protein n=1 Tax=Roseovarius pelagicus TaxID=2980108 RepID=A0ABY6DG07_9RHOB|nr:MULTISPECIES: enoyl-CoA hydratase-related protein [Rhodobacterales]QIE47302.1 3-hydroxybutyryl-CoA dehydratase [Pseudohalocynthiibacter aestuariivivens]UXX84138.1 enoyl-CoA hydratase-related protein [Roseovarius pelagicus]
MSDIEISREDDIAVVTINRPALRNSVTYRMWRDFGDVFATLSADRDVRAILLTGAGSDFSAGADIAEFATVRDDPDKAKDYEVAVDYGCAGITHAAKPVIAVNCGYTLGGGAHLAMSADFRFVHTDAQFGIPAARLSIVYGVQATRKLLSLVGLTNAKRILYSGERFDARAALDMGFADRVCDDPMAQAMAYARSLTDVAPLSQGGAKYILNGAALGTFDAGHADALIDAAAASHDYGEGRAAFAEKRAPRFKGC